MIHEVFAGSLFEPRRQITRSVIDQPLATVIIAYLLAALSWVLSDFLVHGQARAAAALVANSIIYLGLLSVGLAMAMILLHFFAELIGHKGDINALFWGVLQSVAPLSLLVPLALVSATLGTFSGTLYVPGKLGIFCWVFAAQIVAVSEAYRLSVARASFVFFLSYGAGLVGFTALSLLVPLAVFAKLVMILD